MQGNTVTGCLWEKIGQKVAQHKFGQHHYKSFYGEGDSAKNKNVSRAISLKNALVNNRLKSANLGAML
jgi:hypothetical protein